MLNEDVKKRTVITLDGKEIIVETGEVAKQARGSVLVRCGDTVVLVATCISHEPKEGVDFLPLTVDYKEKTYAAGKIPGGFFKREARPREKEILISRLVDRSIRPHFPEGLHNDISVTVFLLSIDKDNDPDMLAMIGASCSVGLSDIPWNGPIAGVRVGRINDQFVINPTVEEQEVSTLNLVVAGRKGSPVMIEGGAKEISEEDLIKALDLAQHKIDQLCDWQEEFFKQHGRPKFHFEAVKLDDNIRQAMEAKVGDKLKAALRVPEKLEREDAIANLKSEAIKELKLSYPDSIQFAPALIEDIIYREVRRMILQDKVRPDGRPYHKVRALSSQVGVLPRSHGSALFTRGQTQALVTTTLGTPGDMQIIDDILGEYKDHFLLHYNFPGFSTGEAKGDRSTGRREIGHGNLARRALEPLLPSVDDFPYTIRIVSDIMESNGSSSMASVCGGSLSLFDAGVPMKSACAGIAMGLVKEKDQVAVLTDIIGLEDFMGDMDFKVAGTREGITAIQMDIKIAGVNIEIMKTALAQAKEARFHLLDHMEKTLNTVRADLSEFAPRMITVDIPVDKIGALIGPGGKNIRSLQEETGATIEVDDDGRVYISSLNAESVEAAKEMVAGMTAVPEIGKVYKSRVVKIMPNLGAFVQFMPGKDGLVHISQLDHKRVERVEDVVKEGDEFEVKVIDIDSQGRVNLSRKALLPLPEGMTESYSNYSRPSGPRHNTGRGGGGRDFRGGHRRRE
ncbi:MAG: Polyribonucleotide nucleotidyltransferase [Elusimicrobia bacterium]|nr:Polyribonucleotide nucleotidyltransferase [Elusimicrobiota bacterium]